MRKVWMLFRFGFSAVTERSTRKFYDRISPFYESLFTEHLVHVPKMLSVLKEQVGGKSRTKVLDIACGTGILSRQLQEQGFSTVALDFSFQSLSQLLQKSNGIPVVQADAASLPFASASFDVVTCLGAWRHFSDPQRVLAEIRRVLTPDGTFFVGYFPPKLGGLISVPDSRFGNVVAQLYRRVTKLLKYDDSAGPQMGFDVLRMLELTFASHRIIHSGKQEYLIFAESPNSSGRRSPNPLLPYP